METKTTSSDEILSQLASRNSTITLKETEIQSSSDFAEQIKKLQNIEDLEIIKLQRELKKEEVQSIKQDREQRKDYAEKIFYFLCAFITLTFIIIFLQGFSLIELSDTVLIALITTTAINVIGIFVLVVRYLFNVKEGSITSKPQNSKEE